MKMKKQEKQKAGNVVLIGRPNAGKSTLINSIVKQKVTITSPKPQTTRKVIKAAYQDERGQIIFWDLPGVLKKNVDLVSKKTSAVPGKNLDNADLLLYIIDKTRERGDEENVALGIIRKIDKPKIMVMNKIDKPGKDYSYQYDFLKDEFDEFLEISALKSTHLKTLLEKIFSYLPEKKEELFSQKQFMENKILNQTSSEFISELIREKIFLTLRQEIPYSTYVVVEKIEEKNDIFHIEANILTNAERYKKMIIGRNAETIRAIGIKARKEIELFTDKKVFLRLNVITDPHWPEKFL